MVWTESWLLTEMRKESRVRYVLHNASDINLNKALIIVRLTFQQWKHWVYLHHSWWWLYWGLICCVKIFCCINIHAQYLQVMRKVDITSQTLQAGVTCSTKVLFSGKPKHQPANKVNVEELQKVVRNRFYYLCLIPVNITYSTILVYCVEKSGWRWHWHVILRAIMAYVFYT